MRFWIRFIAICVVGAVLGYWRQTIGESIYVDHTQRYLSAAIGLLSFGLTFILVHFGYKKSELLSDLLGCFFGALLTFLTLNIVKDVVVQLLQLNDLSVESFIRDVRYSIAVDGTVGVFVAATTLYFIVSFAFVWGVKTIARLAFGKTSEISEK